MTLNVLTYHQLHRIENDGINVKYNLFMLTAGMSTHAKHLETAEVAYSAIMEADKVHYIQYIRELPIKEVRNAEMAVLTGT